MKKEIAFVEFGCLINRLSFSRLENYLIKNNYPLTTDVNSARVLIISACVVKKDSEDRVINEVNKYRDKTIMITGCVTETLKSACSNVIFLQKDNDIEIYFPPTNVKYENIEFVGMPNSFRYIPEYFKHRLNDYLLFENILSRVNLDVATQFRNSVVGFEFTEEIKPYYRVLVSKGCKFQCSYCIIWQIKGNYRSRSIPQILNDIETGYQKGYRKFVLVADELTSYGIDIENKYLLGNLLKNIKDTYQDIKIALRYLEPMLLPKIWDNIKDYVSDDFISYINIPIQSASNDVLKKINRNVDLDCISDIISQIRMKYSGPILTHIMLGFDFETIEDIEQTSSFLQKNFDNTSIHQFSPRPNTKLCNLNINKNIEKHEIIIRNVRTLIRTQYLKKILTNISKVTPQKVQKEKEYRFSAQKVPLEVITKLKSLNWSIAEPQTDIVFMNKDIDGFVARIRHAKSGYFLQFKIKNFEHDWNEISIELNNSEIKTVINVLREYFTPRNVIARTRKSYKYNDKITFYWDSLRHLGEYFEIEGEDTMVDEVLNNYFLLNTSDVEAPYGKILESLNINMDEEIEEVINSFID